MKFDTLELGSFFSLQKMRQSVKNPRICDNWVIISSCMWFIGSLLRNMDIKGEVILSTSIIPSISCGLSICFWSSRRRRSISEFNTSSARWFLIFKVFVKLKWSRVSLRKKLVLISHWYAFTRTSHTIRPLGCIICLLCVQSSPDAYMLFLIFFTTCEKSIIHAIVESTVVMFGARYVPVSHIILTNALFTDAPSIQTKDIWNPKDCRVLTASQKIEVRCPAIRPLFNIYEKGNLKPLKAKKTNWRTVVASWKGWPFTALSIPLLCSPKSKKI